MPKRPREEGEEPYWKVERRAKKQKKKEEKAAKRLAKVNKPKASGPKLKKKYDMTKEEKKARKAAKQQLLASRKAHLASIGKENGEAAKIAAKLAAKAERRAKKRALKHAQMVHNAAQRAKAAEKKAQAKALALQGDFDVEDKENEDDESAESSDDEDDDSDAESSDGDEADEADEAEEIDEDDDLPEQVEHEEDNDMVDVSAVNGQVSPAEAPRDDEDIEAANLAAKAERKAARKAARQAEKAVIEVVEQAAAPQDDGDTEAADAIARAERKAARKAARKTEKAAIEVAETDHAPQYDQDIVADDVARAERKAARKAARKAEKAALGAPEESNGTSTSAQETKEEGTPADSGYTEHPELSALSSAEIKTFLESKQITIHNSGVNRRPITLFKYLPITEAQRAPFKGFTAPTPIQAAAWPYLLDGRDVIGVAETGSGKTLAFGVPCIRRLSALDKQARRHVQACIVSPTRELALQIQEQLAKFTAPFGLKVTCVYGGVSKDDQRAALKNTQIVVATPGRLNDFLQDGSIDLSHVNYMVLDEADRMLDKGFEDEVRKIVSTTASTGRQTLMFTATWPQSVRDLASTFMTNPVRINIGDNTTGELRANARIVQEVEVIDPAEKQQRLIQLLKQYQSGKNKNDRILVFCLYKKEATRIEEFIQRRGFNVAGIHGDLSQQKRTESLEAFKQGTVPILVATDVAARGLDIPAVKLVINVTFPLTAEDYVHRIGRTGRAGQDGRAITFFTDQEKGLAGALINVLKAANQPVPDELLKFGTTVKKKAHDSYGAFYKDTSDMKTATKITFD